MRAKNWLTCANACTSGSIRIPLLTDLQGDRECLWTYRRMCEKTRVIWER